MTTLDYFESSVMGTVFIYPHLQKRMVRFLGKYQFSLHIRQLAYEGIKRIVAKEKAGETIERKPEPEEWIDSVTPQNLFVKLYDNSYHREVFTITNQLNFSDYKKYKCTRDDLEGYLKTCTHQKGVYDIIRFNKILVFLMERAINNRMTEGYAEIEKALAEHEDIDNVKKKNDNLIKNLNVWINELDKRFKENFNN